MFDEEPFSELYTAALDKAAALSGHGDMQIYEEIEPDLPALLVDRIRGARAIATFIAYSVRASGGGKMWVRAERHGLHHVRIDVDVPAKLHSASDLEQMLDPAGGLAKREHRGLALALQLANSVVKLHGGSVHVVDRRQKGAMFCITLPTASGMARPGLSAPRRRFSSRPAAAPREDEERGPDTERPLLEAPTAGQEFEDERGPDTERPPGPEQAPDTERPPAETTAVDHPAVDFTRRDLPSLDSSRRELATFEVTRRDLAGFEPPRRDLAAFDAARPDPIPADATRRDVPAVRLPGEAVPDTERPPPGTRADSAETEAEAESAAPSSPFRPNP
jgi:hypothetical protein